LGIYQSSSLGRVKTIKSNITHRYFLRNDLSRYFIEQLKGVRLPGAEKSLCFSEV
jgi:hypothetical protein